MRCLGANSVGVSLACGYLIDVQYCAHLPTYFCGKIALTRRSDVASPIDALSNHHGFTRCTAV